MPEHEFIASSILIFFLFNFYIAHSLCSIFLGLLNSFLKHPKFSFFFSPISLKLSPFGLIFTMDRNPWECEDKGGLSLSFKGSEFIV